MQVCYSIKNSTNSRTFVSEADEIHDKLQSSALQFSCTSIQTAITAMHYTI